MRILAIETIGLRGSVAALARDRLLAERQLDPEQRSAQSLAPGIAALLHEVGWQPRDIQLVAVATGPGSFTGLRIGVTTAKSFAYAVGCQLIGVHTLAAIAARAGVDRVWTVLDAERGELFAAEFSRDEDAELIEVTPTHVVAKEAWLAALSPGSVVSGPGLERLLERLPAGVTAVALEQWAPTAATVGSLGWKLHESGQRSDVFGLTPQYFRRTAAEEKRDRQD
ncbi:MAG: tRNA (adenosine(37)-N6)-threonylcarbamoyltransferase complex dimerization subunit type 1 TsaB [Pirellulales bacterium]